jgi:plasmid stabilization system protein ParE
MTHVILSPQARMDLLQIVARLVVVAGPLTAGKWDRKLWKAIDGTADFPGRGAPRQKLGAHTRTIAVRPYIVIYEHVRGSGVAHVLRVLHGGRRITRAKLRKRPSGA